VGTAAKGTGSGGHRKTGKKWLEKRTNPMLQRNDKSVKNMSSAPSSTRRKSKAVVHVREIFAGGVFAI
jgi:hypothetical protein